jgi:PPOX class probable F420-dependent enzyme
MANERLRAFEHEEYLNLETYRKTGAALATPVWFAEENGVFYVYSLAEMGKVKRVRNNPRVRIAPCTFGGQLKGDWVDATARIVALEEEARVHGLLNRKYGWKKYGWKTRFGALKRKLLRQQVTAIEIRPA